MHPVQRKMHSLQRKMHPGNLNFDHIAEVPDSPLLSQSYLVDSHYSGQLAYQSQDCAQVQEVTSNIPEMSREGKEADKLYVEKQSPSTQRPLQGAYAVDEIDGSLQYCRRISVIRSTLMEQHHFNSTKRTELNEISAALDNVRSLHACFRPTTFSQDKAKPFSKGDSNGITAPSKDTKINSDFDGPISVLARLTTPHNSEQNGPKEPGSIATPAQNPASDPQTLSTLPTVYTSCTDQKNSKSLLSPPRCIDNASGISSSTLITKLEDSENETFPLGTTFLPSQSKDANESMSSAYACSSQTSAKSTTGTRTGSMAEYSSEGDPNQTQQLASHDLALHLTVETACDEYVLDPGWDELADIMGQLKKAEHVPSVQFSSSSRVNWLRGKIAQAKYKKSMVRRSLKKKPLESKPARLFQNAR